MRDPLQDEAAVIRRFDGVTNPRKIVALAKQIYMEVNSRIEKTTCVSIANDKNPTKYLEFCRKRIEDCFTLIDQLSEEGNHGMIVVDKVVYGVKVNTRANWLTEDKQWDPDDEAEIHDSVIKEWMKEHGKTKFTGKVILFPRFGFSGVPVIMVV